jgi:nitrite reductase (NADH) large subunit
MRYLIVGNGVAGTKAAETIRRRDPEGEIVVLSAEEVPFYRRPALVDHLVGRVPLDDLWGRWPEAFYREAGIELRLGATAARLNATTNQLTLDSGEVLSYDRLLLAVGLSPQKGWLPGSELEGVVTLKRLADVPPVRELVKRARHAVIVGEGVFGLEMARAFRLSGLQVTYIVEGPRLFAGELSAAASGLIEQRLRSEGVELRPNERIVEFLGDGPRLQAVLTASGERLDCQVAGVSAGLQPALSWAQDAGLVVQGRVWADDCLATNLPDVFAAGDCVRLQDEAIPFGWQRAWHQGVVAAVNMTGGEVPYRRRTVSLSTRAFGLPILVMGNPNPAGAPRRERGDYPEGGVYKELVLDDDGRVVGAVMIGEVSEASHVEALVRQRSPYSEVDPELRRRLFDLRYWAAAGAEVLCPVCKFLVHVGEEDVRQAALTCPICGVQFGLRASDDRFEVVSEQANG